MEVTAGPLLTDIKCYASTDPFHADESSVATNSNTSWYSLKFAGSSDATGHRWKISTCIKGNGRARAESALASTSWAESIEIIKFSGDHVNEDLGQLAVHSGVDTVVSFSIPLGFTVSLRKSQRKVILDQYTGETPKTTSGGGQACRVRVDTYAKAQLTASSTLGVSWSMLLSHLHGDLDMVGTCDYAGMPVADTLRIRLNVYSLTASKTEAPSGGIEDEPGVPTDEATEEEQEGDEDDRPVVDADDLPDDWRPEVEGESDPAAEED